MKAFYSFIVLFVLWQLFNAESTFSQVNVDGLNINGTSFGIYDKTQVNVSCGVPSSITLGQPGCTILAGEKIQFCSGTKIASTPGTNGVFNARVKNQLLDATILEPSNTASVPIYEKVEIGVNLPQLDAKIAAFLNDVTGDYKPGTSTYQTAANSGTIINPYDPDHISVDAVFYRPSSPNQNGIIKYGFYYKKYTKTTNWTEVSDPYEWRIRFAPEETGLWSGFINIYVNGKRLEEDYFFEFNVVPGGNHGFVTVASNNQYLQYDDGEQFFPVGDNAPFALDYFFNGDCNTTNCVNQSDHRITPNHSELYEEYLDMLSDNGNNEGGNFTRLIMVPWGQEIEWDRLNNYDSRQIEMSELDRMFRDAEERDVKISLTSMASAVVNPNPGFWGLPNYSDQWEWNPYNASSHSGDINKKYKGISGVNDNLAFFTDPTAKKMYKNKLRYISARWGYSTSFVIHELVNEIDGVESFWTVPGKASTINAWMDEMASYIKSGSGNRQLITTTYLGDAYGNPSQDVWGSPNIDLLSGHTYEIRLDGLRLNAQRTASVTNTYHKPAIFNEHDVHYYYYVDACDNSALHNNLWASAFSGSFGTGLSWEIKRYTIDAWHNASGMDVEKEYVGVRKFFNDVDLVNYAYTPKQSVTVGGYYSGFENLYLVRSDKNRVYGWFHNRSYNHFTHQGNCTVIDTDPNTALDQPFTTMKDLVYGSLNLPYHMNDLSFFAEAYQLFYPTNESNTSNPYPQYPKTSGEFELTNLTPNSLYFIEYYYTEGTNTGLHEPMFDNSFTTNSSGKATISNAPPTGGPQSGGAYYPGDWAYMISKAGSRNQGSESVLGTDELNTLQFGEIDFFPNPASQELIVELSNPENYKKIEIRDLNGRTVMNKITISGQSKIDLSGLSPGSYLMIFETTEGLTMSKRFEKI